MGAHNAAVRWRCRGMRRIISSTQGRPAESKHSSAASFLACRLHGSRFAVTVRGRARNDDEEASVTTHSSDLCLCASAAMIPPAYYTVARLNRAKSRPSRRRPHRTRLHFDLGQTVTAYTTPAYHSHYARRCTHGLRAMAGGGQSPPRTTG